MAHDLGSIERRDLPSVAPTKFIDPTREDRLGWVRSIVWIVLAEAVIAIAAVSRASSEALYEWSAGASATPSFLGGLPGCFHAPFESEKFPVALQCQLSLFNNGNWMTRVPIYCQPAVPAYIPSLKPLLSLSGKMRLSAPECAGANIWGLIEPNSTNWTPDNNAFWLKYSGSWGKPGNEPLMEFNNEPIYVLEQGPPGPAFRTTYVLGPGGTPPTS
jgi:hypothetical protein